MNKVITAALMTIMLLPSLDSCTPASDSILHPEDVIQTQELYDVSLAFTSSDFSITTSRAASSEIPAILNRLSLVVFDGSDRVVATRTQKREAVTAGETFGSLSLKLPAGTYKFVAVLHELPSTKLELEPATITSPTLAALPSNRIYDTYCCVQQEAITAAADQSLTLALGKRINAQFRLQTLDAVPSDISSVDMTINPDATKVPSNPTFNPTTGLATASWQYEVNLTATSGQAFDRSFSILLSEDPLTTSVVLSPADTQNKKVTKYQTTLTSVAFQRNHQTHATGYLFKEGVSIGFTIDPSFDSDINYEF